MRLGRGAMAFFTGALAFGVCQATAQSVDPATKFNVYRYVIDVDVPESPALVPLDLATTRARRASAPKPIAVSGIDRSGAGRPENAFAIDVSPYFIAGRGTRTLQSYKRNSVGGRLMRVLTKTLVSVAIAPAERSGGAGLGFGIRSTIHDPHDPVLNWGLADSVIKKMNHVEKASSDTNEDVEQLFARAREEMRGRCCVQIALGWGGAVVTRGGILDSDSASRLRQQLWGTFQITTGQTIDLLLTPSIIDFTDDVMLGLAAGALLKGNRVDVRGELQYRSDGTWLPGGAVELHVLPNFGAVASVTTERDRDSNELAFGIFARWYYARRR